MKLSYNLLVILFLLLLPLSAHARIIVLVHGYLSDGRTWEENGVIAALSTQGWQYGGQIVSGGIIGQPTSLAENRVYIANLPFTAPLVVQSDVLQSQIRMLTNAYPDQKLTIVGHSAGGVAARLVLVRHGAGQVDHLVTIASPHLGTPLTYKGLDITDNHGPFEIVKRAAGGTTYKVAKLSRELYNDLRPAQPGTFLFWLNGQSHPDITYTSILRSPLPGVAVDDVVPTHSQDMNRVAALVGKSAIWKTPAPHYLRYRDGELVARLLKNLGTP